MTLSLERVGVRYGHRVALRPTSLGLQRGALVGLIGPNGAGKSSLIKAVAGLLRHSGRVLVDGTPLERLKPLDRARTIAYLPQTPRAHWPIKAADLVALGRMPHRGFGEREQPADRAAVERALEQCDAAAFADRGVDELSGGERARVLLARALAVEAPVLLVDEPIQSLDPRHQLTIMRVLRDYAEQPGGAHASHDGALVVAVLHDIALAARFCTRTILLAGGAVVGDGEPLAVLTPDALERHYRVHPYVARHEGDPVVVPWRPLDG